MIRIASQLLGGTPWQHGVLSPFTHWKLGPSSPHTNHTRTGVWTRLLHVTQGALLMLQHHLRMKCGVVCFQLCVVVYSYLKKH